jgi:hypothetical protein
VVAVVVLALLAVRVEVRLQVTAAMEPHQVFRAHPLLMVVVVLVADLGELFMALLRQERPALVVVVKVI